MSRLVRLALLAALGACVTVVQPASNVRAQESLWIEAEHFDGIRGFCWPMGKPEMKKASGFWGLSGPGWAAEWNQGGESGFLSIAAAGDDANVAVTKDITVPAEGAYSVWVRYGDWREKTERFQVKIDQAGAASQTLSYGEQPVFDEDNEAKLYWGWAFAWDQRPATLKAGPARLTLLTTTKDPEPRQVDVIVLTTDPAYRPRIKDRPRHYAWEILDQYRGGQIPDDLEPLARRRPDFKAGAKTPEAWNLRTFNDRGFVYLWNVNQAAAAETWLSDKPNRVKFPYQVGDQSTREEFEKVYGGRDDVPIFSDPRIVPTFHGAGPGIFATDAATGEVNPVGQLFAKWLDAHPDRNWGMMMNYHPGVPIGEKGVAMFQKYRPRFVGSIAGESLGYFYPDPEKMKQATSAAQTRRQLVEAFTPVTLASNREKYQQIYGRDLDANPYQDVIPCLSVGNIIYAPLAFDWGARVYGYESAAATSTVLGMRWAFMRGAARQHAGLTATYRSCNFGDSATIFSDTGSYHGPKNLLDNYYSVFSGAGMTWYKFDIWYQYMAGSSMFYHEQGFDEFWTPGGTTAAGIKEVQLSPKGKLVDRFLKVTAKEPDRGQPYTPIAFLVDHAHGWEPSPYWPNSFKNWHQHEERFRFGDHEKMLEEYFWTAFHPIGRESERPITGTNEVYVPGVFGDIFDVIYAYPDVAKWRTIDSYPVVVATGEIELTAAEGKRLADYVAQGGTLLVADAHLTGPGVAALSLPQAGAPREAAGYRWLGEKSVSPSQRFSLRPLEPAAGLRTLATTDDGQVFCAAMDRGAGRLIYLSVPRGLGIDRQAHPVLPRLLAHLSRGLMPVEVAGDVQWLVNRSQDGWLITLLNPAGQLKPQQGITPTDFRENRRITVKAHLPLATVRDRLLPQETFQIEKLGDGTSTVTLEVPAGGVRVLELK